jgi:hypothetical protein
MRMLVNADNIGEVYVREFRDAALRFVDELWMLTPRVE